MLLPETNGIFTGLWFVRVIQDVVFPKFSILIELIDPPPQKNTLKLNVIIYYFISSHLTEQKQ